MSSTNLGYRHRCDLCSAVAHTSKAAPPNGWRVIKVYSYEGVTFGAPKVTNRFSLCPEHVPEQWLEAQAPSDEADTEP